MRAALIFTILIALCAPVLAEPSQIIFEGHVFRFAVPDGFSLAKDESDRDDGFLHYHKQYRLDLDDNQAVLINFGFRSCDPLEAKQHIEQQSRDSETYRSPTLHIARGRMNKTDVFLATAIACDGRCLISLVIGSPLGRFPEQVVKKYQDDLIAGSFEAVPAKREIQFQDRASPVDCISSTRTPTENNSVAWTVSNSCNFAVQFDYDDCQADSNSIPRCEQKSGYIEPNGSFSGSNYQVSAKARNYR